MSHDNVQGNVGDTQSQVEDTLEIVDINTHIDVMLDSDEEGATTEEIRVWSVQILCIQAPPLVDNDNDKWKKEVN